MLCKFTGSGPENGIFQEIADEIREIRCAGLTPGYSEIYTRDPKRANRFIYKGQVVNAPYVPGFVFDKTWEEVVAEGDKFFACK